MLLEEMLNGVAVVVVHLAQELLALMGVLHFMVVLAVVVVVE
jgi:hypothetical protein